MHPAWKGVSIRPVTWRNILAVRAMKGILEAVGLWCWAGSVPRARHSEWQVLKHGIRCLQLAVLHADRDPALALQMLSPHAHGTGMSLRHLKGNQSCAGMHMTSDMCPIRRLQAALRTPEGPCCNAPSQWGAGERAGRESCTQK